MNADFANQIAKDYYYNKLKKAEPEGFPTNGTTVGNGATIKSVTDLPQGVAERLLSRSKENQHNQYLLLLSALSTLLYRYGIKKPVIVSNTETVAEQPTFFSPELNGERLVKELVSDIKTQYQEIENAGHCDIQSVLELLQANVGISAEEPFQVAFSYNAIRPLSQYARDKSAIHFEIESQNKGYQLVISHDEKLYTQTYIDLLAQYYVNVLDNLLSNTSAPLKSISVHSKDSQQRFLEQVNDTEVEVQQGTVLELLQAQCVRTPEKPAIHCGNKSYSFRELSETSDAIASHLISEYAISKGDLVAVMIGRSEWTVMYILAILKSGAAYLPIDPEYPEERINFMLEDSGCKAVILDNEGDAVQKDSDYKMISLSTLIDSLPNGNTLPKLSIEAADLAYMIYTSGSTGKPKGVKITHGNLMNFSRGMTESLDFTSDDHLLAVTSVSFDISILELVWTICNGIETTIKQDILQVQDFDHFVTNRTNPQIDFSFFYFSSQNDQEETDKYKLFLDTAKFADDHQFKAVWTPERHFHEFGGIYPNPAITGAALATSTKHVEIRSGSVVLPIHDVVRVAEEWSVVDNLSGGRVGLSIASGWHADDFIFFPDRYENRVELMYDNILQLKKLWQGESIKRGNGLGKEVDIKIFPRPIQKELPIWVTAAGSPATFESAGKIGANILTHLLGQEVEDLAEKIIIYKKALTENGYDPEKGQVVIMLHTYLGQDLDTVENEVSGPFKGYLRSSIGLLGKLAKSVDIDLKKEVSDEIMEELVDLAFQRYWQTAALLGTKESCAKLIRKVAAIGVTEVACLVDFGLSYDKVMQGLPLLNELMQTFKEAKSNNRTPITALQTTPSLLRLISEDVQSQYFLKETKKIVIGGEKLPQHVLDSVREKTNASLYNVYGPTETTIWSTCAALKSSEQLNVGRPIANTQIYVVDEDRQLVPVGAKGEVLIGGHGVAPGYHLRDELTADRFIQNPVLDSNDTVYRTGDIGSWNEDGTLNILGRSDSQIKLNGRRIELGEIESALASHEQVKETAVVLSEQKGSAQLMAFMVLHDKVGVSNLRAHMLDKLPDYMVPAQFFDLERMPLTPNGKTDRKALLALNALPLNGTTEHVKAQNEIQETLISVWQDILDNDNIGIKDNFFLLGGDSIKAVQIAARMHKGGYKLQVRDIFLYPDIEQLWSYVVQLDQKIDQGQVEGEVALAPIQAEFFADNEEDLHHHNQSVLIYAENGFDEQILQSVFQKIQSHHDALRMTFDLSKGQIKQTNHASDYPVSLEIFDLSSSDNAVKEMNLKMKEIQSGIDLNKGPLMRLGLFRMSDGDRLLIAIHHLVIDGISWRILLEDIDSLYQQYKAGKEAALPLKTTSFQSWSRELQSHAYSVAFLKEKAYWKGLLDQDFRKINKDFDYEEARVGEMENISLTLNQDFTNQLLTKANEAYNTEINDLLIASLIMSLRQFYDSERIAIALEGHGRQELFEHLNISRTVGWFTTIHPVVLNTEHIDDLSFYISEAKEALRQAPNQGIGYGMLRHLSDSEHTADIDFDKEPDVLFNYLGQFDTFKENGQYRIADEPTQFEISDNRILKQCLDVSGMINEGQLTLSISYSPNQFKVSTIQQLGASYKNNLQTLITHCIDQQRTQLTPHDLTLKTLAINQIRDIEEQFGHQVKDIYTLSPIQEGTLFHVLYEETKAYHHLLSYRMHGRLEMDKVRETITELKLRYDVMRTAFIHENVDKPLQVVLQDREIEVTYEDLRNSSEEEANRYIEDFKNKDIERGFDLQNDTLFRLAILHVSDKEFELIQSHHHIILDGWSANLLNREFHAIYESLLKQDSLPERPQVIQYNKYIEWLLQQEAEASRNYWGQYLQGYEKQATIPASKPSDQYTLGIDALTLRKDKTSRLTGLAAANNVTLNTLVNAIWGVLLSRYNDTRDVVFGTIVAGRPVEVNGVEEILGHFINTVPVRVKYDPQEGLDKLLGRLHDDAIEGRKYHYSSLADIQTLTALKQDLIDHIVIFENFPVDRQITDASLIDSDHKLAVTDVDEYLQTNYAFNLMVIPGEELTFKFSFDSNQYTREFIDQIKKHLLNVIDQLTVPETDALGNVQLMSPEEQRQLVAAFNPPIKAIKPTHQSYIRIFEAYAENHPTDIAIKYGKQTLTCEELNHRSTQVATAIIQNHGLIRGSVVAVAMPRSEVLVVALLAIAKSGCTFLPIDIKQPAERTQTILADSDAKLILVSQRSDTTITGTPVPVTAVEEIETEAVQELETLPAPAEIAYILYTSGSTGKPKGVEIYERSFTVFLQWANRCFYGEDDIYHTALFTPITFDLTMPSVFCPLLKGDQVHIYDEGQEIIDVLENIFSPDSEVNAVKLTPSHINALMFLPIESTNVKTLIAGGEKFTKKQVDHLFSLNPDMTIFNEYGPTEATVGTTIKRVSPSDELITIGKPADHAHVLILNEENELQPMGVAGEIFIAGLAVAKGYLGNPAMTQAKFVENPYADSEATSRMYKTGDLGRWLPNGEIEYLGRVDDQIKIRGHRIEPGEIEAAISAVEGIKEVTVVAREDAKGITYLTAYYISDGEIEASVLRESVSNRLPEYMVPSFYMALDEIPLTTNGKLDRSKLPDPQLALPKGDTLKVTNDVEKVLLEIWNDVLETPVNSLDDNFFEIGGHSLKVIQMVSRIRRAFDVDVQLKDIFKFPTIASQVQLVKEASKAVWEHIDVLDKAYHYAVSHAQKRLWIEDKFEEKRSSFNMPGLFKFSGNLDIEALKKAFELLIDRHEILRTTFTQVDGQPYQVVHNQKDFGFEMEYVDLSQEPKAMEMAKAKAYEDFEKPFDLQTGSMMRARLTKLSDDQYAFMFVMHHIITDGWSNEIMFSELLTLYNGLVAGKPVEMEPLRIHYKDYAAWHNGKLKGESGLKLANYWNHKYAEPVPVLNLPLDYDRKKVDVAKGGRVYLTVDKETTQGLRTLGNQDGHTIYFTLLASVATLIYRYTAQKDFVIGTPVTGREHDDLADQIGFYINTLALRFNVDEGATFQEFLRQVYGDTLEALEHQLYPLDMLVESLDLERGAYKNTLIDFGFTWNRAGDTTYHTKFDVEPVEIALSTSKVDMWIYGSEDEDHIYFEMEYNMALFKEETAIKLGDRLIQLLKQVAQNAQLKLDDIELDVTSETQSAIGEFDESFDLNL
ncbi:MAG: amino acid adenylation domain-containing protein [Bacteroidota bacterium]